MKRQNINKIYTNTNRYALKFKNTKVRFVKLTSKIYHIKKRVKRIKKHS